MAGRPDAFRVKEFWNGMQLWQIDHILSSYGNEHDIQNAEDSNSAFEKIMPKMPYIHSAQNEYCC